MIFRQLCLEGKTQHPSVEVRPLHRLHFIRKAKGAGEEEGVFVLQDIPCGSVLGLYLGMWSMVEEKQGKSSSRMVLTWEHEVGGKGLRCCVDGEGLWWNAMSRINHYRDYSLDATAPSQKQASSIYLDCMDMCTCIPFIVVVSSRDLRADDEVFVDYGDGYFAELFKMKYDASQQEVARHQPKLMRQMRLSDREIQQRDRENEQLRRENAQLNRENRMLHKILRKVA